jgi:hypothetical protein
MRVTTDTLTGKPFRWNTTVDYVIDGRRVVVPARMGQTFATHLHPHRVPAKLLAKLNPEEQSRDAV